MRAGVLDRLEIPHCPIDVLMQQIVAACAAEPWEEDALFEVLRRAHPYSQLTRKEYDEILCLLAEGIEASRGRYGSYLLRDRVHGRMQSRRGARTIAVSNGGTIPDTALYSVIVQPEGVQIATLDEDFAIDSSAGDVILLGNTSWRIQRVESAGRVLVEDAHGQPPNVPFWRGEAPQRTLELSRFVSTLRQEISARTGDVLPGYISQSNPQVAETVTWLKQECCVDDAGAEQMIGYMVAGRAVLGAVPALDTIIAERFFDEGGGMQLILHAPFGGRINKAWGLALRKRFCRGFNFELQAAATDNGLNISLAEQHSFPLGDVFDFLTEQTVTGLLEQASLDSPIFRARWRWDAGRSLQLLRFYNGKRIAPQVQRTRSDDLLASVFPQVAACQENIEGDIQIPDHPLIREVMKDVLTEAMDLEGLIGLLAGIRTGAIRCLAVDSATPSAFAHELLNANPYAFLDDAPLEERRARAVSMRGMVPDKLLGEAGRLDPTAIAELREECWPDVRDEHELHDLLCSLMVVPTEIQSCVGAFHWPVFFERLATQGRATVAEHAGQQYWVAAERMQHLRLLWPGVSFERSLPCPPEANELVLGDVVRKAVQGWMALLGPVTSRTLGVRLGLEPVAIWAAMLVMEMQGTILRGVFEGAGQAAADEDVEWCERRLLQRIHKRTLAGLRKQIEPVTPAVYLQWLMRWQKVVPRAQLSGESGVLEALRLLEGFEAPAIEWERTLLPQRVAGYDPRWLDTLCLEGVVGWGRISPHPAFSTLGDFAAPKRVVPTSMAPVTFFLREEALWMDRCLAERAIPEPALQACLSELAWQTRAHLSQYGAVFAGDLVRGLGAPAEQVNRALWELVAAGLVTADGFDSLRVLIDPRRKAIQSVRRTRNTVGRWSLLNPAAGAVETVGAQAERREAEIESACWILLRRYGVVFRDVLERETTIPRWRELVGMFRRLEARGSVRGGRFVNGFGGEQFAVPEAVASLRESRLKGNAEEAVTVAATDPLNLAGIVVPGERPAAVPGKTVTFLGGVVKVEEPALAATAN
jgi:ATP-dependent helicase Lhr and Lhr-like helicase